jgi:hypothetical protein
LLIDASDSQRQVVIDESRQEWEEAVATAGAAVDSNTQRP